MKAIRILLERVEELSKINGRLETELLSYRNISKDHKSEVSLLKGEIEVLKSIIDDQAKAIKEAKDECRLASNSSKTS